MPLRVTLCEITSSAPRHFEFLFDSPSLTSELAGTLVVQVITAELAVTLETAMLETASEGGVTVVDVVVVGAFVVLVVAGPVVVVVGCVRNALFKVSIAGLGEKSRRRRPKFCSVSRALVPASRTENHINGPTQGHWATAARAPSRIAACSVSLTAEAEVPVGAPNSVNHIFLSLSPHFTMIS